MKTFRIFICLFSFSILSIIHSSVYAVSIPQEHSAIEKFTSLVKASPHFALLSESRTCLSPSNKPIVTRNFLFADQILAGITAIPEYYTPTINVSFDIHFFTSPPVITLLNTLMHDLTALLKESNIDMTKVFFHNKSGEISDSDLISAGFTSVSGSYYGTYSVWYKLTF